MKTTTLVEKFSTRWTPEANSGCWLWDGYVKPNGYGEMTTNNQTGQKEYAHRVSWMVNRGPIPQGLHVLHKCDMRCCVNPDHLFLGTNLDNILDARAKGRSLVKMTIEKAREIRSSLLSGVSLAKKYGVHKSLIYRIRHNEIWKEA